jgi:hypothetical protein
MTGGNKYSGVAVVQKIGEVRTVDAYGVTARAPVSLREIGDNEFGILGSIIAILSLF